MMQDDRSGRAVPFVRINQESGLEQQKESAGLLLARAKAAEAVVLEGERKAETTRWAGGHSPVVHAIPGTHSLQPPAYPKMACARKKIGCRYHQ